MPITVNMFFAINICTKLFKMVTEYKYKIDKHGVYVEGIGIKISNNFVSSNKDINSVNISTFDWQNLWSTEIII